MTVFSIHSSITGNRDQHQMIIPAYLLTAVLFFSCLSSKAQDKGKDAEAEKTIKASENLTYEANKQLAGDDFEDAEVSYRKAIAKNPENATAKYNLGNAYYRREDLGEAFSRYKQAGETATDQAAKHRAYHNLGNVFMKNKEYQKAVEAYKEALRNDPTDEETRYNLALAKEMLEKNPPQNNDDNKDDKNQDQNKDKDQQDQDKQDQNQGGEDNKDQDQKDQGDQGDKGDQPEDNKDKGNDDKGSQDQKDQGEDGQPEDGEGQPQPGQSELSPQQIQALLEAMGREEKRVQDKINAQKAKGAKTSTEKDW